MSIFFPKNISFCSVTFPYVQNNCNAGNKEILSTAEFSYINKRCAFNWSQRKTPYRVMQLFKRIGAQNVSRKIEGASMAACKGLGLYRPRGLHKKEEI